MSTSHCVWMEMLVTAVILKVYFYSEFTVSKDFFLIRDSRQLKWRKKIRNLTDNLKVPFAHPHKKAQGSKHCEILFHTSYDHIILWIFICKCHIQHLTYNMFPILSCIYNEPLTLHSTPCPKSKSHPSLPYDVTKGPLY